MRGNYDSEDNPGVDHLAPPRLGFVLVWAADLEHWQLGALDRAAVLRVRTDRVSTGDRHHAYRQGAAPRTAWLFGRCIRRPLGLKASGRHEQPAAGTRSLVVASGQDVDGVPRDLVSIPDTTLLSTRVGRPDAALGGRARVDGGKQPEYFREQPGQFGRTILGRPAVGATGVSWGGVRTLRYVDR